MECLSRNPKPIVSRSTVILEKLSAGDHSHQWKAESLSSGVYFYRLQARQTSGGQAGTFTETKKLVLLR
jgi:hypothetical protein